MPIINVCPYLSYDTETKHYLCRIHCDQSNCYQKKPIGCPILMPHMLSGSE
jgi:hypothetical protein